MHVRVVDDGILFTRYDDADAASRYDDRPTARGHAPRVYAPAAPSRGGHVSG